MDLDQTKSDLLDAALEDYVRELRDASDDRAAVTLGYTHSQHRFWRQVLRMLPVPSTWSVLDAGSGFGILGFELTANQPVRVDGIDADAELVAHSDTLQARFDDAGLLVEGSELDFTVGDITELPLPDAAYELAIVREVCQFLPNPDQAIQELFRVVRPHGYVCLSDMDDQLHLSWPPPHPALNRLVTATAELQNERGGDRHVGRKLSSYLRAGGFEINSIIVLPDAQHRLVGSGDPERALTIEQLHAARDRVLGAGSMSAEQFDADLREVEHLEQFEEFRLSTRIVVLGQKP